jgi:sugar phosphate isomerase/epimerase
MDEGYHTWGIFKFYYNILMENLILCDGTKVEQTAQLSKKYHCGIEVQAFYHYNVYEKESEEIQHHLDALQGISLRSLHGFYGDLAPGSFDPMVRAVARQRLEMSYRSAVQLGSNHIIFHHGYVPNTSTSANYLKRSIVFWLEFLEDKDPSIHFHVENMLDWDAWLLTELVDAVNRPNLDANLDLGHAHALSRQKPVEWIKRLGKRIGYTHIHDNHGESDDHLGLGKGNLPLIKTLEALNEHAPQALWGLEVDPAEMENSIRWLQVNGFLPA